MIRATTRLLQSVHAINRPSWVRSPHRKPPNINFSPHGTITEL